MRQFIKQHLPPSVLFSLLAWKNYCLGERELRLLDQLVDPARAAIDIGANRGYYTYFLSRLCPKVFAYEPNPTMAEYLRGRVAANVDVMQLALSDAEGFAHLNIPLHAGAELDGYASLNKDFTHAATRVVEVRTSRLDNQGHDGIGFIKIDVEGHEENVIDGARDLILRDRPVLMVEIEQRHLSKPIDAVFDKILALGYSCSFERQGTFVPLADFSVERDQTAQLPRLDCGVTSQYVNNFIFRPEHLQ